MPIDQPLDPSEKVQILKAIAHATQESAFVQWEVHGKVADGITKIRNAIAKKN